MNLKTSRYLQRNTLMNKIYIISRKETHLIRQKILKRESNGFSWKIKNVLNLAQNIEATNY